MTTDKANYTFLRVRRKGLYTTRGSARARTLRTAFSVNGLLRLRRKILTCPLPS